MIGKAAGMREKVKEERERDGNGEGLSLAIFDAFGRGLSILFNPLTYQ